MSYSEQVHWVTRLTCESQMLKEQDTGTGLAPHTESTYQDDKNI